MAERRMFAKSIVLSDAFLDMPMSARCLYFTLGMLSDDDGFIGSPKAIMRQCGASEDDMKVLISKRYVLTFESGVIVIKHWRINNYLRDDRHKPTTYIEEKETLAIDGKGAYTEAYKVGIPCANQMPADGIPSIGKDSIGKDSIKEKPLRCVIPPTLEMVKEYCEVRHNNVDPDTFFNFYSSKGWKVGRDPMKDWQACVRTWEKRYEPEKNKKIHSYNERNIDYAELEAMIHGQT